MKLKPWLCEQVNVKVRSGMNFASHYCTDSDVTWGNDRGCPLVVHYLADLQSVHRFCCCDNIAPNAICQRVLVLALCLVCFVMAVWSKLVMVLPTSTVTLHEAHLHLRWVTISRYNVLVCNQPPRPTQPPTPAGWLDEVQ